MSAPVYGRPCPECGALAFRPHSSLPYLLCSVCYAIRAPDGSWLTEQEVTRLVLAGLPALTHAGTGVRGDVRRLAGTAVKPRPAEKAASPITDPLRRGGWVRVGQRRSVA